MRRHKRVDASRSLSSSYSLASRICPASYLSLQHRSLGSIPQMIIPIHVSNVGASTSQHKFPPQLAQFGSEEVILIELQGSLEAEGDKQGQTVGKLRIDDATVSRTRCCVRMLALTHLARAEEVHSADRAPSARGKAR